MWAESKCFLAGRELDIPEVCLLQRWLMEEYCEHEHLERHEWAKNWVERFATRCRELLEAWVPDIDELKARLYN